MTSEINPTHSIAHRSVSLLCLKGHLLEYQVLLKRKDFQFNFKTHVHPSPFLMKKVNSM